MESHSFFRTERWMFERACVSTSSVRKTFSTSCISINASLTGASHGR